MSAKRNISFLNVIATIMGCCKRKQSNLPANGAAAFRWGSYIDTDLATFFSSNHTLMLRFMAQYERAYEGPLLANTGAGTYRV